MVVDSKEIVVVDCQAENRLLTRIHAKTIRAWIRSRNFEPFEQRIAASYVRILCTHVGKHASLLANRKSINRQINFLIKLNRLIAICTMIRCR